MADISHWRAVIHLGEGEIDRRKIKADGGRTDILSALDQAEWSATAGAEAYVQRCDGGLWQLVALLVFHPRWGWHPEPRLSEAVEGVHCTYGNEAVLSWS